MDYGVLTQVCVSVGGLENFLTSLDVSDITIETKTGLKGTG